jgi:hypothetical protein
MLEAKMKYVALLVFFAFPSAGFAQHSHVFGFAAAGGVPRAEHFPAYRHLNDGFANFGGGGEYIVAGRRDAAFAGRIGLSGEAGAVVPFSRAGTLALVTGGLGLHFGELHDRIDPYLVGGIGGIGRSNSSGFVTYYGGGVNFWTSGRFGLKLEFRDNVTFADGESIHFLGMRFGFTVRF